MRRSHFRSSNVNCSVECVVLLHRKVHEINCATLIGATDNVLAFGKGILVFSLDYSATV